MKAGFIFGILVAILVAVTHLVWSLSFYWGCEAYLKRAADSSTVEIASKELDTALNYIERHNLTSGYSALPVPSCDIGFWYDNIKNARMDLDKLDDESAMAKTNALMKLREVLLDGQDVTLPTLVSLGSFGLFYIIGEVLIGIYLFVTGLVTFKDF